MIFCRVRWIKKTRKEHRCWWCGEGIAQGTTAFYAAGMSYDSDFWHGHSHPECQAAMDSLPYDDEGYLEHEHARGRTDDDRQAAPEFSAEYRGRTSA